MIRARKSAGLFAGVVLLLSGGSKLAVKLGLVDDADFSRRIGMVTVGLVLAYIGNSIPKTLTPLSTLQCDGARNQAFQRWSGWIWVLAGLGYGLVWMVAPIDHASPISMAVVVAAMIAVVTMLVRLWRSHRPTT
jgi:Ca2+/Na+ antiporter